MRKIISFTSVLFFASIMPLWAQTENQEARETFSEKFTRLVNLTVSHMEQAGHAIGDAIGFDDRVNSGTAEIARHETADLMPICTETQYRGADAAVYIDECRLLFAKKYPNVEIVSVALPQKDWDRQVVKEDGKVVGYLQSLNCYVLGKDGEDGYINARFSFQRYKEVGDEYRHVVDRWPLWERTDAIPAEQYEQIK